jgi:uncharacterized membrane protein YvlD (DUF360 family)
LQVQKLKRTIIIKMVLTISANDFPKMALTWAFVFIIVNNFIRPLFYIVISTAITYVIFNPNVITDLSYDEIVANIRTTMERHIR